MQYYGKNRLLQLVTFLAYADPLFFELIGAVTITLYGYSQLIPPQY